MKKIILLFLVLCMTISLVSCKGDSQETTLDSSKLAISVSFNAMAEFVYAVGQDKVQVSTVVPDGTEPHDFEPKATDIRNLSKAKVFVYNGFGMESWVDKFVKAADNKNLLVVVASDNLTPIQNTDEDEIDEHGAYDPHLWLSIKSAQGQVQNIAMALSSSDPANKEFYEANAADYISQLEALFDEYEVKFSSLTNKYFVTGHAAFNYFCRDFGLEQNSVEDVFAEGEPSSQQLAKLVEYCKKNKVTTIFAEDMASPKISQTLANEVGAKVETINTIESADGDLTYLQRMKDNCEKIYTSLSK